MIRAQLLRASRLLLTVFTFEITFLGYFLHNNTAPNIHSCLIFIPSLLPSSLLRHAEKGVCWEQPSLRKREAGQGRRGQRKAGGQQGSLTHLLQPYWATSVQFLRLVAEVVVVVVIGTFEATSRNLVIEAAFWSLPFLSSSALKRWTTKVQMDSY